MTEYLEKKESNFLNSIRSDFQTENEMNKRKEVIKSIEFKLLYWLLTIILSMIVGYLVYQKVTFPFIVMNVFNELNYVSDYVVIAADYVLPLSTVLGAFLFDFNFAAFVDYSLGGFILSLLAGSVFQLIITAILILVGFVVICLMYLLIMFIAVCILGVFSE